MRIFELNPDGICRWRKPVAAEFVDQKLLVVILKVQPFHQFNTESTRSSEEIVG
jgi:hypothetical protein